MFAKDVLRVLKITRPTLTKYVKTGIIQVRVLPNGRYDYNEDDVYRFLNKDVKRKTFIYARVSTPKQKADLDNQIEMLKQFCFSNGYTISGIYSDIANGINFEKRKDFFQMLEEIVAGRVAKVVITSKDRLSRVGFEVFRHLCDNFNCEIITLSDAGSSKSDSQDVFEEIVSLLHCYSMKLCSKRRLKLIKEALSDNAEDCEE